MSTHYLNSEGLYVLSGLPGAGKSHLLNTIKQTHPECVVCADDIRQQVLGSYHYVDENSPEMERQFLYGWTQGESQVFNIVNTLINTRCENKLPTIVDMMNLTEKDRKKFYKMAQQHGVDFEVLILDTDLDQCLENNSQRSKALNSQLIREMADKFETTSHYQYRTVNSLDQLEFKPLTLTHDTIDVVGDVHGLYNEFEALINQAGYQIDEKLTITHPDNRTLVFIGDIVDRGPDSLKMLEMALRNQKNHYFLLGNHELKLINYFKKHVFNGNKEQKDKFLGSFASMETFNTLLKEPRGKQEAIYNMLLKMPCRLQIETEKNGINEKIGLVHANNPVFDPIYLPRNACVYGSESNTSTLDTDKAYDLNYDKGYNQHVVLRGHIPSITGSVPDNVQDVESEHIFSLDAKQAFSGELALLPVDQFLNQKHQLKSYNKAFKNAVKKQKSQFDFQAYEDKARQLQRDITHAVKQGWVTEKIEPDYNMKIYKFSRKVFWDGLWDKSRVLSKTRGLVLDCTGQIVQHPFDKTFNYGEQDAGKNLDSNYEVRAVEKINGFLGCITHHPYENRLLVTTTGSFDSDFVNYIHESMTQKQSNLMKNYLSKNDVTLMFEVVHPEDPHIIEYTEQDYGLWLIGARTKGETDPVFSEEKLDEMANQLDFKRPSYKNTTINDILNESKQSKLEGWVVRDKQTDDVLFKLKTSYYLVTKFVGRMGKKKVAHMFNNPENFKKSVDEEFVFLVDLINQKTTQENYLNMDQQSKVAFVRNLIDNNIEQQFNFEINDAKTDNKINTSTGFKNKRKKNF